MVSAKDLGLKGDRQPSNDGKYGAKLTAIVEKVKEIISSGDRLIVFVQFDDLRSTVSEPLSEIDISSLQVQGTIGQQIIA